MIGWLGFLLALFLFPGASTRAQEFTFARPDPSLSIRVDAPRITRWVEGNYEVLHLADGVAISQGPLQLSANEAIVWVQLPDNVAPQEESLYKVIVFLDGDIEVAIPVVGPQQETSTDRIVDQSWLGRLFTAGNVDVGRSVTELSGPRPALFAKADQALREGWSSAVRPAQFSDGTGTTTVINPQTGQLMQVAPEPAGGPTAAPPASVLAPNQFGPGPPAAAAGSGNAGLRPARVEFSARDALVDLNARIETNPANPDERVFIATGGVRVTVDSPDIANMGAFQGDTEREITILADQVVAWQTSSYDGAERWEIYLEGNVVFSKGRRVIYAERMYYDANNQQGTILTAEVLTPAIDYDGLVRLKADVVQQVDENNLQAYGAAFTTSSIGVPRYWVQSDSMLLTRREVPAVDPDTNLIQVDPATGLAATEDEYFVDSRANRVYLSNVPVFFWPRYRANLEDPGLYLEQLAISNDNIFGNQILTGWDTFRVLGLRPPEGVKTIGQLDYLSERGTGFGSETTYQRDVLFGVPGQISGFYKTWFIRDKGLDFLGRGRGNLIPEEKNRGRVLLNHRHQFNNGWLLRGEIGWLSDRNFQEQYYEREWDTYKDATTGVWLQRNVGTQSFNLIADYQINDFFTQTSWLPRLDHFVIGQPLWGDRLLWHGHSQIGYGEIGVATEPLNPSQAAVFEILPWEANVNGLRAGTRQEIDFPTQIGPTKLVPYVLGDATYWQEDLNGDDLFRGYGQAGIRASLPFWRVDPTVQSTLWNVNGLAHKISFDVDAFYADSNEGFDQLAFYDPMDDDSQEDFRRRFAFYDFGGTTPLRFDPRYYAFRGGMQSWVTAPVSEIANDLSVVKFGARQRWQTKRGAPGNERIIDWITLDVESAYFPNASRDNFNSDFGMLDYDFRWHVGDRFTLVSDGYFDFFSQGLRTASFGAHFGRPGNGNLFLGYRSIEGPISSNIVTASMVYRMSEKWGVKGLSQVDFGEAGSIGQSLSMVYIGESFLWQFGVFADFARENFGFRFGVEPRFLKRSRIFNPGGLAIGPAGARWLE